MGLFGKGKDKGRITVDQPEMDGKVIVNIKIKPVDRFQTEVKTVIVEQQTGETVYRSKYVEKGSKTEYHAYVRAEQIAKQFCRNENYIPNIVSNNLEDDGMPKIKTTEKRSR
ncbi:hypothetical protein [Lentibacillus daqui]|uniref:hypothetical protein n=1 Tax=Lentibacillus daqui TaxID=2911514 RepID=UPI0022B10226|nr:hypothetical protein [Lentibacillus daqui]